MSYHVTPLLTTIHWHNSPRINPKIYKHQAVLQTLLILLALLKHLRAFALTVLHLTHLQISAGFTPWRFCSNVVSFKETSFTILSKTAIISFSSHFSCSVFFITLSSLNIYLCDSLFILSLSLWYDVNSRRTEICHWFTLSETLLFQKQNSLLVVPGTCQILIHLVYLTHLYSYLFIYFCLGKLFPRESHGLPLIPFTSLKCCLYRQVLLQPSATILQPLYFSLQCLLHLYIHYLFVPLFIDGFDLLKYKLFLVHHCIPSI